MATGRIGTTPVLTTRWSKAPAAGTTSLSGLDDNSVSLVYSVGYEAVYQNGVLLSRGNDYTATNGTTITLTTATVAGDIIEVFANQTIPLTDTYSQTVSDGRFIKNTLITTTGDIIYASAANTPARLGIGSTNQVLTVSGGVPTWATPAGGGKVLQVVFASSTTLKSSTSTTYADTDITATITPSSTSSKILVMVVHAAAGKNADASNGLLQVKLMRGATEISNSGDVFGNNNVSHPNFSELTMIELDSPATTSATTYKTQYRSVNGGTGAAIINNYYNTSGQARSTITLMEIGA